MAKVLADDESTVQVEGPNGPIKIAKKGVGQAFLSSIMGGGLAGNSPEAVAGREDASNLLQGGFLRDPAQDAKFGALQAPAPSIVPGEPGPLIAGNGAPPVDAMPAEPIGAIPMSVEGGAVPAPQGSGLTPAAPKESAGSPGYLQSGMADQIAGIKGVATAAEAQGRRDADYLSGLEVQMEQNQAEKARVQAEKAKFQTDKQIEMERVDRELAEAAPKDYWADRSTGAKIAAAIAIGMGAYASAMGGGPNNALGIIESAIKRDVDLQAAQRGALKDKRQGLQNMYQLKLQEYGDRDSAIMATQAAALASVQVKLQKSAVMAKTEEAKSKALMLSGEVKQRAGELYATLASKQAEAMSKKAGLVVPMLGGDMATTEKGAQEINELIATNIAAKDGIGRLKGMIGQGKSLSPEARAEAQTLVTDLKATLKKAIVGEGAVSESEWKLLDSIIRNPTTLMSLPASEQKALSTLEQRLDTKLAARAKAYGLSTTRLPKAATTTVGEVGN